MVSRTGGGVADARGGRIKGGGLADTKGARRLRAKARTIADTRGSARELGVISCGIPDARAAKQVKGGGVRRSSQAHPMRMDKVTAEPNEAMKQGAF